MLNQDLPRGFLGQLTPAEVVAGLTPRLDVLMTQHQDNVRLAAQRRG
jgi:multiple sugar transport system substrate-binding protein